MIKILMLGTVLLSFSASIGAEELSLHCRSEVGADPMIVFVHGVLGGENTWTNTATSKQFFDLLCADDEIPEKSVYIYQYESSKTGKALPLFEVSENLYQRLEERWLRDGRPSSIVFIAHSMGGLIVRDMLEERENDFLEMRCTIVSLGCPNHGNFTAELWSKLSRNPQFKDMSRASVNSWLGDLNNDWVNSMIKDHVKIVAAYEREHTYGQLLVDTESAKAFANAGVQPFLRSHAELAKPSSEHDILYRWTRHAIQVYALGLDNLVFTDLYLLHVTPPVDHDLLELHINENEVSTERSRMEVPSGEAHVQALMQREDSLFTFKSVIQVEEDMEYRIDREELRSVPEYTWKDAIMTKRFWYSTALPIALVGYGGWADYKVSQGGTRADQLDWTGDRDWGYSLGGISLATVAGVALVRPESFRSLDTLLGVRATQSSIEVVLQW